MKIISTKQTTLTNIRWTKQQKVKNSILYEQRKKGRQTFLRSMPSDDCKTGIPLFFANQFFFNTRKIKECTQGGSSPCHTQNTILRAYKRVGRTQEKHRLFSLSRQLPDSVASIDSPQVNSFTHHV